MVERDLALAATGQDEAAFMGWGHQAVGRRNTRPWSTGREILGRLTARCRGGHCIKKLYVFSHAWAWNQYGNLGGLWGGGPNHSGLYHRRFPDDHRDARYLHDLEKAINRGRITFCDDSLIILTGCRVAASRFPRRLATITGANVISAKGASFPKPAEPGTDVRPGDITGEWLSGAGSTDELNHGGWLGWVEHRHVSSGIRTYRRGTQTPRGRLIDLW